MINLNLTNNISVHNNIITISQEDQFFTIVCADKEDVDENLQFISDFQKVQQLMNEEDNLEDIANSFKN